MIAEKRGPFSPETAEMLAIEALGWIAADEETLSRFVALTGLDLGDLRGSASEPGFLAGILDYLAGDEPLLLAFAQYADIRPERVMAARYALSGNDGEAS